MLPFYSSILTPEEQEEIEEIIPEELAEELAKVKFPGPRGLSLRLGMMDPGLYSLMGPTTHLPLNQFPGDIGLQRDG